MRYYSGAHRSIVCDARHDLRITGSPRRRLDARRFPRHGEERDGQSRGFEIGRYGSAGIELVLTIFILGGLGHWLDGRYWGRSGWGTGVGFLLGVVVAFWNLIRTTAHMQRDIERAEALDPAANRWNVDESWLHKGSDADPVARGPDADHSGGKGPRPRRHA